MNHQDFPQLSKHSQVFFRDVSSSSFEYEKARQQYATSSVSSRDRMWPAVIVYPSSKDDILKVLSFAADHHISIAVRSGGHSFHGGSSTGNDNIQMDVSKCTDCKVWHLDESTNEITIGTGWTLGEIETMLETNHKGFNTKGLFFAHGNCSAVGLGGHMHTGGIAMQTRSFGMLVDFVCKFTIITPDGRTREVVEPDPDCPNQINNDLWFAVLGGGQGNFGICTDVTLRTLHERDFPESRAYMQSYFWTRQNGTKMATAILKHFAKLVDEDSLPADFTLHVVLAGAAPKYFTLVNFLKDLGSSAISAIEIFLQKFKDTWLLIPLRPLIAGVLAVHRGIFGRRNGRMLILESSPVPLIVIQATWNNLSGKRADYDDSVQSFFEELDDVAKPYLPKGIKGRILKKMLQILSPEKHTPIKNVIDLFTFKGEREYDLPYLRRNWAGFETNLQKRDFPKRAAKMFEFVSHSRFTPHPDGWHGVTGFMVWGYLGGRNSVLVKRAETTKTSLPNRRSTVCWVSEYFYDPVIPGSKNTLMRWISKCDQEVVGHPDAVFSDRDCRYMYHPFDTEIVDDHFADPDLHKLHPHFYDSPADYQRILALKRQIDPNGIFSPHKFSVGGKRV